MQMQFNIIDFLKELKIIHKSLAFIQIYLIQKCVYTHIHPHVFIYVPHIYMTNGSGTEIVIFPSYAK